MLNPAETYEDYIVPALFSPWAAHLVEMASPSAGQKVLDVACGTGIVARHAASIAGPGAEVVGIDPSPAMLAVAHSRAAEEGLEIEWREAPAEQLPFPDASFDLVLCQQGLQFFQDRKAGLAEMHRVLRPGGRVFIAVWQDVQHHHIFDALDRATQRHLGSAAFQVPFSLGSSQELESLLVGTSFVDIEIEKVSRFAAYPDSQRFVRETLQGIKAVLPPNEGRDEDGWTAKVDAIHEEVSGLLNEVTHGDQALLEWQANIARARRAAG